MFFDPYAAQIGQSFSIVGITAGQLADSNAKLRRRGLTYIVTTPGTIKIVVKTYDE
jgi:hypothetical protein